MKRRLFWLLVAAVCGCCHTGLAGAGDTYTPAMDVLGTGLYGYVDRSLFEDEGIDWETLTPQDYVLPPQWEDVWGFYDGFALVKKDGEWGVIDTAGRYVTQERWANVYSLGRGYAEVPIDQDRSGVISLQGRLVAGYQQDRERTFKDGNVVSIRRDGAVGFRDMAGNWLLSDDWKAVFAFSDGLALVRYADGLYGYIDARGQERWPTRWYFAEPFFRGYAVVAQYDTEATRRVYACIDTDGAYVIPPYERGKSSSFFDPVELFVAGEDGEMLQCSLSLGPMGGERWSAALYASEDMVAVKGGEKYGFYSLLDGRVAIPPAYDSVGTFSQGLAAVRLDGLWGIVDREGNEVLAPSLQVTEPYLEQYACGRLLVRVGGISWKSEGYYLDVQGRRVSDTNYSTAKTYSDDLALVWLGDAYAYIDTQEHIVSNWRME